MTDNSNSDLTGATLPEQPATALEFDRARYESELVGVLDLTEAQRTELLTTLWSIMQNMVELGYSVANVDICGSIFGDFSAAAKPHSDELESSPKRDGAEVVRGKAGDDAK